MSNLPALPALRHLAAAIKAREVGEFEAVGLEKLASHAVAPPRVKGAPVHLECELALIVDLTDGDCEPGATVTMGRVVGSTSTGVFRHRQG